MPPVRACTDGLRMLQVVARCCGALLTVALVLVVAVSSVMCGLSGRADAAARDVVATSAGIETRGGETSFKVRLSAGVVVEVFTLADPYRVIIDMPNVAFRFPEGTGTRGAGLVSEFRYGLFAAGKGRIVIDTTGPVTIERADMRNIADKGGVELAVTLAATDAARFGRGTGPQASDAVSQDSDGDLDAPKAQRNEMPVVVIDPGHGGVDPGAVGDQGVYEKDIVLAVGRALKAELQKTGRFKLVATRMDDVFISLDDRLRVSRKAKADLFISLHADSLGNENFAERIRGATVYTLSARASDEQARLMAEKENRSDLIAGLSPVSAEHQDDVTNILIDLMKRETADFAADFSNVLVSRLKGAIPLSRKPQRSAAFKVLKQTRTPAVLVELGYLSNATDRKLLRSKAWQKKAATAIADAVKAYFEKRTARAHSP